MVSRPGDSYVVFGDSSGGFGDVLDRGRRHNGPPMASIRLGLDSGAGDSTGTASPTDRRGRRRASAGASYVVFGDPGGFGGALDLAALDGTNGFRLDGIDPYDHSYSVSGAGDVNGDGFADLIVGAFEADPGGRYHAGESYVVFGDPGGFGGALDLASLDGTNGFRLEGIDPFDTSGSSVSGAGDVNGDGFADLIVGAARADPGGRSFAGESYVVFGGNFTGAVTQLGGAGDDTLTGTPHDDVLLGAQGDDTLLGNGGVDVLNGGEGDDLLALLDPAFLEGFGTGGGLMVGGTGSDTLRLDGAGADLDLGAIPDPRFHSIESIDLNGEGNALAVKVLEILNLDDASNTLTVLGDDSNAVGGSLPGAVQGTTTVGGVDFDTFTVDQAQLLVQTGVDTSGIEVA